MDYGTISQLITTIGFPIVMCGAMAWYIKDNNDKHRSEVANLNQHHKEEISEVTNAYREEMSKVREALNSNTMVLQKLTDRIGG